MKSITLLYIVAIAICVVGGEAMAADDTDAAGSMGFMPLANYIFGSNRPGETIGMTAPVTTARPCDRPW